MNIFDQSDPRQATGPGGLRAAAENYAASLGMAPGTPGWGAAVRDFVMNQRPTSPAGAPVPMRGGLPGPGAPASGPGPGGFGAGQPFTAGSAFAMPDQVSPDSLGGSGAMPGPGIGRPAFAARPGPAGPTDSLYMPAGGFGDSGPGGSDPFAAAEPPAERVRPVRGLLAAADQEGGPVFRRGPMGSGVPARRPEPPAPPPSAEPAAEATAREVVMRRIRRAESTNDAERNRAGSTATGRYQFTEPTFVGYYRRAFPNSRETRAQILRHITDGAIQERLMHLYMDDSERVLQDAEAELTPGNLYFVHVAGHPAAERVLANPDGPITEFFNGDAIRQNGWSRDWTGGDVVRWANRRMAPPAPARPQRRR